LHLNAVSAAVVAAKLIRGAGLSNGVLIFAVGVLFTVLATTGEVTGANSGTSLVLCDAVGLHAVGMW
jgi:hypothetical protein